MAIFAELDEKIIEECDRSFFLLLLLLLLLQSFFISTTHFEVEWLVLNKIGPGWSDHGAYFQFWCLDMARLEWNGAYFSFFSRTFFGGGPQNSQIHVLTSTFFAVVLNEKKLEWNGAYIEEWCLYWKMVIVLESLVLIKMSVTQLKTGKIN